MAGIARVSADRLAPPHALATGGQTIGHSGAVTNEHAGVPLRRRSVVSRWALIAIASLWALGVAIFVFGHHIDEPRGVLTINIGGRTYAGNPPALTLYQKDRVTWEIALFLVGIVILLGAVDLLFRTIRRLTVPGVVAMVAGGLLVAYSLFGLLYGLFGLGSIGVLVILAGLPMKPSRVEDRAARPPVP